MQHPCNWKTKSTKHVRAQAVCSDFNAKSDVHDIKVRRHRTADVQCRRFLSPWLSATRIASAVSILLLGIGVTTASAATQPLLAKKSAPSGCSAGSLAHTEPSGALPPRSVRGYHLAYCNDFRGSQLPAGWSKFDGVPGGDPGGMFLPSHVLIAGGLLRLNTSRDASAGNNWATGGTCQCSVARTYGAYFVRSRVTSGGDDNVELLWPAGAVWPPEIDFNETSSSPAKTGWYVHYTAKNHRIAKALRINLTKWHTWGVIWTPTTLTFTVDGKEWGVVKNSAAVPHRAMTLDIQQQTLCGIAPGCPTKPLSMLVDWVVEFAPARR